ncbi:MAG: glycosyltransferase family 4 protein [Bacteroidota bacterium]
MILRDFSTTAKLIIHEVFLIFTTLKTRKIAYLSSVDPNDKRAWSGTHFSILSTLRKSVGDVEVLGPYNPLIETYIGKALTGISQKISGKRYDYRHSHLLSKSYAKYFGDCLKKENFDCIVAPAASCEIAHLETKIPIFYISDTTFKRSLGYHKALSNLTSISEKAANEIESMALQKSTYVIVSSEWAAESVLKDYGIEENKIRVIPFGPNMENLPDINNLKTDINSNQIEILFPAVYWENKGGDIAVNCLKILKENNINARLMVVGCTPPEKHRSIEGLEFIPYLNKNESIQLKKLQELFFRSDFLILPTRFDCTPVVFCEASAFGLPSLCTDTGGVRGHIKEGLNGFLFDYKDDGQAYAKKIIELISNKNQYFELRETSRKMFEEKLNWENWAREFKKLIN